jgi:DNA-binding response OmpR family regulator
MTHVLLIEDNLPDAALVRDALKREGLDFAVHECVDAEAAAVYVERMGISADVPCPEIVIIDLNLPRGDGIELLKQIREHPKCAGIPVLIMTSSDAPRDRAAADVLGNTRFFRKPLDLDAFLRIGSLVREILR